MGCGRAREGPACQRRGGACVPSPVTGRGRGSPGGVPVISSPQRLGMERCGRSLSGSIKGSSAVGLMTSEAIQVELEHVEGHALTVLLPYTKKRLRRGVDYGPLRAEACTRRIWR